MADGQIEDTSNNTPTQLLRNKLAAFRFDEASTPSLRRSPRNIASSSRISGRTSLFLKEEEESELPSLPQGGRLSRKRSASVPAAGSEAKRTRSKSVKRVKVEYAPPEKYAHLNNLNDHLGDGPDSLDVMFCGINPGKMSATVGHHFAHPTNHFWKCLYGSQLTGRLLSPSEDHTLPDSYRLGLTNLVERPSSQAAELAGTEFTAGVPTLLRKIVRKRPHVVCFVGKGIWDSFIKAAATPFGDQDDTSSAGASSSIILDGQASEGNTAISNESSVKGDTQTRKTSPTKKKRGSLKRTKSSTQSEPFTYDLQPWKVVHSNANSGTSTRETLFFVVVSTSGLVAGYQLSEKIRQFTLLKQRVDELKGGELDTSAMRVIPIPPDIGSISS